MSATRLLAERKLRFELHKVDRSLRKMSVIDRIVETTRKQWECEGWNGEVFLGMCGGTDAVGCGSGGFGFWLVGVSDGAFNR